MNLKFDVKEESPAFSSQGKYWEVTSQLLKLPIGKWLVISNMDDVLELNKIQAAVKSPKNKKLLNGTKFETRRNVVGETIELWIRKVG